MRSINLDLLLIGRLRFWPIYTPILAFSGLVSEPRRPSVGNACSAASSLRSTASVKRPKLTATDRFVWAWLQPMVNEHIISGASFVLRFILTWLKLALFSCPFVYQVFTPCSEWGADVSGTPPRFDDD